MFLSLEPESAECELVVFDDANGFPDGLLLAGGRVKDSIFAEYLELARAIGFCVELAVRRDVRELFIGWIY